MACCRKNLFPLFPYSTREYTELFNDLLMEGFLHPLSLNREQEFSSIMGHKLLGLIFAPFTYKTLVFIAVTTAVLAVIPFLTKKETDAHLRA